MYIDFISRLSFWDWLFIKLFCGVKSSYQRQDQLFWEFEEDKWHTVVLFGINAKPKGIGWLLFTPLFNSVYKKWEKALALRTINPDVIVLPKQ